MPEYLQMETQEHSTESAGAYKRTGQDRLKRQTDTL